MSRRRPAWSYARVSSESQEREGWSLPAQVRGHREYALRHGLDLVEEVVETESARTSGRPRFDALVRELQNRTGPRVLLVDKVDRATRNLHDYVVLDELVQDGVEIHAVREGIVIGPGADPSVTLMWGMQVLWAKSYVDRLSHEVRKGMSEALRQGRWPHRAPLGLVNRRGPGGRAEPLGHDPERAPLIRKVAEEMVAKGLSLRQAAVFAAGVGLRSRRGRVLQPQELAAVLTHPLMAGWLPIGPWRNARHPRRGVSRLVDGAHEPVIPRATWQRLVALLGSRGRGKGPRDRKHRHAYAGVFHCGECGRLVSAERKNGAHLSGTYVYYRCGARCGKALREDRLEAAVAVELERLRVPAWALEYIRESIGTAHDREQELHAAAIGQLQAQHERLQVRLATAYTDRLDGRITPEQYDQLATRWQSEQDQIRVSIDEHVAGDRASGQEVMRVLELAQRAAELFRDGNLETRRDVLAAIAARATLRDGAVTLELAAPFGAIAAAARNSGRSAPYSPLQEPRASGQYEPGASHRGSGGWGATETPDPSWRRVSDAIRTALGPGPRREELLSRLERVLPAA